jgi:hypothetical protein
MKIWGTVRRPVRSIISSRRPGSRSTSISVQVWPLDWSRRLAMSQYGQAGFVYIRMEAIVSPVPRPDIPGPTQRIGFDAANARAVQRMYRLPGRTARAAP